MAKVVVVEERHAEKIASRGAFGTLKVCKSITRKGVSFLVLQIGQ
jgi:hypothetical protein